MDESRGEQWAKLLLNLAVITGSLWLSLPEHKRREIQMRTVSKMRSRTQSLARTSARWAMYRELDGSGEGVGYSIAYDLMTKPYQKFSRIYDRLRGAS